MVSDRLCGSEQIEHKMAKNILISGANFINKGAQAMLFVTVDEIKKRMPGSNIYFASMGDADMEGYAFHDVFASDDAKAIALDRNRITVRYIRFLKDFVKMLIGRKDNLFRSDELVKQMPSLDLIIDISGYNLGSKWSVQIQESYLDNLRLAKKYDIPIVLMPQSFGPFDYEADQFFLKDEIANLLPYAKKIYAREKEGYQMLKDEFHLRNTELSSDLVLQNKGIDLKNIFSEPRQFVVPEIKSNAAAIVPNWQCFKHGNENDILSIYKRIIEALLDKGKEVYILAHSSDDLDSCKDIFALCKSEHLHLLKNDFSCLEYDELVKRFDFIVCSRYHGAVHAYRNCVPCILLGWAVKYEELAQLFEQRKYSFDLTSEDLDISKITDAIETMCMNGRKESRIIQDKLESIRKENCFDFLSKGSVFS